MKASVIVLAVLLLLATCGGAAAQVTNLVPGEQVEKTMSEGERHVYEIELAAQEFLHVTVEQLGIDVVVSVIDPGGETVA
jgi:hypothetical protein